MKRQSKVCVKCAHWQNYQEHPVLKGVCRLNPPGIIQTTEAPDDNTAFGPVHNGVCWPITYSDDWCGQFEETP